MLALPRTAALSGALLLLAALPLAVASPAAAITPTESLSAPGFGGYSTGTNVAVRALSADPGTLANLSLAQSAAGVGVDRELVDRDVRGTAILFEDQAGRNAYGHGSAVNVGLGQDASAVPQIPLSTAEALSPPPTVADPSELLSLPAELAALAQAQLLPSTAQALTTSAASACPTGTGGLISQGTGEVANVQLLSPGAGQNVATVGGTGANEGVSDTESQTRLAAPSGGAPGSGLVAVTTQSIAPVTLFRGIPGAELTIEVLHRLQLRATATGGTGSDLFYGFVRADGTAVPDSEPVLLVNGEGLTTEDLFGGDGVQLSLGLADVFLGAPAHGLNDNPTSSPTVSSTTVAGAADLIRIVLPGTVATGTTTPVAEDSPLAPVLNPVLTPVVEGLAPVTSALQSALADAGLGVADLRIGHLEAQATVPAGGITGCDTAAGEGNPFTLAAKDASSEGVAPGQTFEYTVRFQNTSAAPVTDVRVVDVVTGGPPPLEFVSSDPAPSAQDGDQLTYDIGTVAPGAYVDIALVFRVPADAAPGTTYRNTATITGVAAGQPVERVVDVAAPTVIAPPTGACDLAQSTKYASHLEVETGQELAYYVNLSNTGGEPCTGVTVVDELDAGVEFVSCSNDCTSSGRTVTWDVGTVGPGASTTLAVRVRVTATEGRLPNAADATSNEGSTANPSTPGPTVTGTPVFGPGAPAGCPATGCPSGGAGGPGGFGPPQAAPGELPRTGAAPLAALGGLLLVGGAFGLRRHLSQ